MCFVGQRWNDNFDLVVEARGDSTGAGLFLSWTLYDITLYLSRWPTISMSKSAQPFSNKDGRREWKEMDEPSTFGVCSLHTILSYGDLLLHHDICNILVEYFEQFWAVICNPKWEMYFTSPSMPIYCSNHLVFNQFPIKSRTARMEHNGLKIGKGSFCCLSGTRGIVSYFFPMMGWDLLLCHLGWYNFFSRLSWTIILATLAEIGSPNKQIIARYVSVDGATPLL